MQHGKHFIGVDEQVGRQAGADVLDVIIEKSVLVQSVDYGGRDGRIGRTEVAEIDLPEQMLPQ